MTDSEKILKKWVQIKFSDIFWKSKNGLTAKPKPKLPPPLLAMILGNFSLKKTPADYHVWFVPQAIFWNIHDIWRCYQNYWQTKKKIILNVFLGTEYIFSRAKNEWTTNLFLTITLTWILDVSNGISIGFDFDTNQILKNQN